MGMRWGVRKGSKRGVTKNGSAPSKKPQDPSKRRMSNKELKARVTRLKLEADMAKHKADIKKSEYDLKSYEAKLKPETKSKVEKIAAAGKTALELGTTAKQIYDLLGDFGVIDTPKKK